MTNAAQNMHTPPAAAACKDWRDSENTFMGCYSCFALSCATAGSVAAGNATSGATTGSVATGNAGFAVVNISHSSSSLQSARRLSGLWHACLTANPHEDDLFLMIAI
jgi:hypothetical protein